MKHWMADKLVCPACSDREAPLDLNVKEEKDGDVLEGKLGCPVCRAGYPIRQGVAVLLAEDSEARKALDESRGYNSPAMLSSYLWSHFCDLFGDPDASEAYKFWSSGLEKTDGDALDIGCAVGRLTFDMVGTHDRAVGIDTSAVFVQKAREIMFRKRMDFDMIVEGHLTKPVSCDFGDRDFDGVEFIVADAMALPFRSGDFATVSAINVLEKVSDPLKHLEEVDRMLRKSASTFVFSDPFSWDENFSPREKWLGGNGSRIYSARGIDTMRRLFSGEFGVFNPPFNIVDQRDIKWKIRKTAHLFEHIVSQYLLGRRN
jgi:SAM-dependent methyltransferase